MIYNKSRHTELIILSKNLKRQGKYIFKENPEEHLELLKYNVEIEEQVFWSHREDFFSLIKHFLNNKISFDKFEINFTLLYRKVVEEVDMVKLDLEQIEKFQPSTRSDRFATDISAIFRKFDVLEDEFCTKQEVKDYVEKVYLKFRNSLTEE